MYVSVRLQDSDKVMRTMGLTFRQAEVERDENEVVRHRCELSEVDQFLMVSSSRSMYRRLTETKLQIAHRLVKRPVFIT